MMRKLSLILTFAIFLAIVGAIYLSVRKEPEETTSDIRIGQIPIDYQKLKELQQEVNQGHQPWRLDPRLAAEAKLLQYGFVREDIETLKLPCQGNIWTLLEIQRK